jgi:membrane protein YqaA with SNARE-associated domain
MNESTKVASRPGVMRAMYAWTMTHAQGPKAWWALAGVSFAESSFFPIPPDVMLVPMVLADRRRAFVIAAWAMLWSVLGGMLGYAIGAFLYDSVGHWLISA